MSWLSGYKAPVAKTPPEDPRETKRKKLEAEREERLVRAKQRSDRQKLLQSAIQARQEADQAFQDLLAIDPDLFEGDSEAGSEVNSDILNDTEDTMPDNDVVIDFEDENGADDAKALQEACRSLERFQWDQEDLSFTFNQLEIKMSSVGVKKQYTK